eukprot:864417-Amorphochlora_amoeboformis.AAC.1
MLIASKGPTGSMIGICASSVASWRSESLSLGIFPVSMISSRAISMPSLSVATPPERSRGT